MGSLTIRIERGPLAELDLIALGARTELMWRSSSITLVGVGPATRTPVKLGGDGSSIAAATAHLASQPSTDEVGVAGAGPLGFVTLPFDRAVEGVMLAPRSVIGERDGMRFATLADSHTLDDLITEVADAMDEPLSDQPTSIDLELGLSAEAWRDDVVQVARDRIADSDLKKAVLAREVTIVANAPIPVGRALSYLTSRFEHAQVFAVDGFIGASPEQLVSRNDRVVRANPLAGTAPRSADAVLDAANIEALRSSTKDRIEHQITIDWFLSELLAFCSYVDAEPEPSVLTLANVHHLGTLVEGMLSEPAPSVLELVDAVHPTPALGGDPQTDALALIDELEGIDRGRYGGPTGWMDAAGNGEFAVSVRCAQIDDRTATVVAGVGVVAQSDPQAELEETQAKFRAMLGALLHVDTAGRHPR